MTAIHIESATPRADRADAVAASAVARRRRVSRSHGLLVAVIIAALAAAALVGARLGGPAASLAADPDLARLLRGMAAIKASMVVAAVAILAWRFAHPIDGRAATGYVVGVGLMASGTMLIWQLSAIVPAALVFHVGLLLVLVVSWRDDRILVGLRRRATR